VSASSPSSDPGVDKRRSTRVVHAIPIVVRGMDALGQAFKESTTTVMVNCNGCKCRAKHYVPKDSRVTVEIAAAREGAMPRIVPARVVWVQRPRTFRDIFHVALEFEVPGNVWGIESPPADWFQHPDDEHLEVPVSSGGAAELAPHLATVPSPYIPPAVNLEAGAAQAVSKLSVSSSVIADTAAASDRGLAIVMPAPPQSGNAAHSTAREIVTEATETAILDEAKKMLSRLEMRLQDSVQDTVKSIAENIADAAMKNFVERAAERTASMVAEATQGRPLHGGSTNGEPTDTKGHNELLEGGHAKSASRKAAATKAKRKPRKSARETVAT
jgi:hypothetical protein